MGNDEMTNAARVEALSILSGIEELERPGLKPIKKIEMYKKWREIVPIEYWEEICPKPSHELLTIQSKELNEKQQKMYSAKKKRKAPPPLVPTTPVVAALVVKENKNLMQHL